MLQAIVDRAQRSVDTLVSKYVTRAIVAVPFIVAMGFGTAAATVKLTEEFGSMTAYAILAAAFGTLGLVAASAIAMSNPAPVVAEQKVEHAATSTTSADAKTAFDPEVMLAALGAIGPTAIPGIVRLLTRNMSLVLAIAMIAYLLFWDAKKTGVEVDTNAA